jgi:glycosyltransferase involved in cell wall biosynthesis
MVSKKETLSLGKKCLVLSHGPVPIPEHPIVEGGGLRCWGLAKGIKANSDNIDVTVAYQAGYSKDDATKIYESINIATWTNDNIADLIKHFDSIIVSYCMGDLSIIVEANIRPSQQLILDCYVPIFVEVSARQSKNIEDEYHAFEHDVPRWVTVLKRGDLFLCASDAQKRYYQGVLSAIGRINPATYGQESILIVPYGIYRDSAVAKQKPITNLIKDESYKKVLWFGGIYPWFDLRVLVEAIYLVNQKIPTKLVIVGAKNPYNTHPDFVRRYDELIQYLEDDKKLKDVVVMQDWIKFEDRADWYLDSDCVVIINKEGPENELAWRTRLVDFIWANLPIITNGGDPLGETLIENDAAFRFSGMDKVTIADDIGAVLENEELDQLHKNLSQIRDRYYWDKVTNDLTRNIVLGTRSIDLETFGIFNIANNKKAETSKIRKVVGKSKKVSAYASKYGYKATAGVITEMVKRKLTSSSIISERKKPAYVFVSHQLDMSGAPFIAIDMAIEFKKSGNEVEFYTYLPAHTDNLSKLNKEGIKPHILMNKDMAPSFLPGDTIILNTVAHSETVKEAVFSAVEKSLIKQIIWYLHEDDPDMLFRQDEKVRIKKMLDNNRMKLLIAAKKMRQNYTNYFDTNKNILLQPYRHIVPSKYHRTLKESDFSKKLTFVLPGTMGDGRKGQLPIFYAFVKFLEEYYKNNENEYRDFELVYIGLDDDFLSRQVLLHKQSLDGHFSYHGRVAWEKDLDIVSTGNITICYSIRECLPLFVFEGMINGHPILRNDSSGIDEQLIDGKNGFYLESSDFNQVVKTLEEVLNKSKTTDKKLAAMSNISYNIAKQQEKNTYLTCIKEGNDRQ